MMFTEDTIINAGVKNCPAIITAPGPAKLIPRSVYGDSVLIDGWSYHYHDRATDLDFPHVFLQIPEKIIEWHLPVKKISSRGHL